MAKLSRQKGKDAETYEGCASRTIPIGEDISVARSTNSQLIVQDDTEKRTMHLQSAVVVNEPELSELVHEEIHS